MAWRKAGDLELADAEGFELCDEPGLGGEVVVVRCLELRHQLPRQRPALLPCGNGKGGRGGLTVMEGLVMARLNWWSLESLLMGAL